MHVSSRLNKHFAVAAAAAVCAGAANAAIIQSPISNLVIPANINGLYINVETGANDANFGLDGWDINPYGALALAWYNASGAGMMRFPGVTNGSAGSLGFGTVVSGAASIGGSGAVVFGANPGNWSLNASNYFGFRFLAADGLTHYGFGRMDVGATKLIRTLAFIQYESDAGVGITVTPAPGAVALLGLAGLISRRRRA